MILKSKENRIITTGVTMTLEDPKTGKILHKEIIKNERGNINDEWRCSNSKREDKPIKMYP